jgi:hypothetical protein
MACARPRVLQFGALCDVHLLSATSGDGLPLLLVPCLIEVIESQREVLDANSLAGVCVLEEESEVGGSACLERETAESIFVPIPLRPGCRVGSICDENHVHQPAILVDGVLVTNLLCATVWAEAAEVVLDNVGQVDCCGIPANVTRLARLALVHEALCSGIRHGSFELCSPDCVLLGISINGRADVKHATVVDVCAMRTLARTEISRMLEIDAVVRADLLCRGWRRRRTGICTLSRLEIVICAHFVILCARDVNIASINFQLVSGALAEGWVEIVL